VSFKFKLSDSTDSVGVDVSNKLLSSSIGTSTSFPDCSLLSSVIITSSFLSSFLESVLSSFFESSLFSCLSSLLLSTLGF